MGNLFYMAIVNILWIVCCLPVFTIQVLIWTVLLYNKNLHPQLKYSIEFIVCKLVEPFEFAFQNITPV